MSYPTVDSRTGEPLTGRMDTGEFVSSMDNMDTLAELGDEFTLGDIDGE